MKIKPQPPSFSHAALWRRVFSATALWFATVAACLLTPSPEAGDSSGITLHFPEQLGNLRGEITEPSEAELKLLPEDTEFAKAVYYPESGDDGWDAAHCSIIRTGVDRRSIHRPEICMQGQGWSISGSKVISIPVGGGKNLEVTDLSLSRSEETGGGEIAFLSAHYVYWFVGKDLTTPSNSERLVLTVSDNLFRNINHRWAYASVMAYATDTFEAGSNRSSEETAHFIYGVIRDLYAHLHPSL